MSLFQDFLRRLLVSKISFLPRSLLCHPDIFRREVQGGVGEGLTLEERKKRGQRNTPGEPQCPSPSHEKASPTLHPTAACWGLGDAVCLIYLLFLLGRLRFLYFQLMLDCTVSNKWNEFSDLILVLRLLSTSLSDCTAWHKPGWVSSLWSWEARPGIAGGFRSGAKWSRGRLDGSALGSAMCGDTAGHNERASSASG